MLERVIVMGRAESFFAPQGTGLRALRGGPQLGITLALYEIIDDS